MTPHFLAHVFYIAEYIANDEVRLEQQLIYEAVARRLQTLAESAHKLPTDIKTMHPEIQWQRVSVYRNLLAHDYLEGSNPKEVWNTIQHLLPVLKKAMLIHVPNWEDIKQDYT